MNNPASSRPRPTMDPLQAKKEADAAYTQIITMAGNLLETARHRESLPLEQIDKIQEEILSLFKKFSRSLLMECLNVVRVDHNYYRYHSVNVALLNMMIAEQMELEPRELANLARIGIVHDLGMMRIPPDALAKTSELSQQEIALIRSHPEKTMEILQASGEPSQEVIYGASMHHERHNGTGYPHGLAGDEIPLEAQITAVADTYDAAMARKTYRKAKSPFVLLAEISDNPEKALNPTIAKTSAFAFAKLLVGRRVTLSDNSIGIVLRVNPRKLTYPIVQVVGKLVQTGPELYPLSLSGYMPLF